MAGYICKIVIEDTHPPVWRRVLIPDKITFYDLHQIIQVIFQWEEEHLHDFRFPSDNIVIEDQEGFDTWEESYKEFETTIDPFFEHYKWIRYTYDFGDDWRHKINIEKYDPDYHERAVKLLKYKGDNFMEDSGGIWSEEENRFPFDEQFVKKQLGLMSFPEYEQEDMYLDTNLLEQYPAFSILFMTLRALQMSEEEVLDCLDGVIDDIQNGHTLDADQEGMWGDINRLLVYKKENQICSEEYIYLLTMICIHERYFEEAKKLIKELSESSNEGKNIAEILNEEMKMAKEDKDEH